MDNMILTPEKNLYGKYGNPYRVAEFRIFSFNNCSAGCKNCFYLKSNNNYSDFSKVYSLGMSLKENGYVLESCYLLPTDVFENEFNYQLFDNPDFIKALSIFNFIGLASTLRNGFDSEVFDKLLSYNSHSLKIELHVNLREDMLGNPEYLDHLQTQLKLIKEKYQDKILINLALNLGTKLSHSDHELLQKLIFEYSDDKILEMNYTFLFNPKISREVKIHYLKSSYATIQYFTKEYAKVEKAYTGRTLLRKPAFVFKDERIFLTPIIPFDEFIFLDEKFCELEDASFESFLNAYNEIDSRNIPILEKCEYCEELEFCAGKKFFTVAQHLELPCIKEAI